MNDLAPVGFGRLCFSRSRLGRAYGHDIVTDKDGTTRYCDDLSVLDENNLRPCAKCGLNPSDFDGDDPCMARLPGVRNACCGHGRDDSYVEFEDGRVIKGQFDIYRRNTDEQPCSNPEQEGKETEG